MITIVALELMAPTAQAQRVVHWQLEPAGFPSAVAVFVDQEESGVYRSDLPAKAFALSLDEFVGDQGGVVNDLAQTGQVGAQVLLLLDRSRTYTGAFDQATKSMTDIVSWLDPTRDSIAIASTPTADGYQDIRLEVGFTSDREELNQAIQRLTPLPGPDVVAPRLCRALSDAISLFPDQANGRYRAVVFLTAGMDRGEGRGDCVERSIRAGKVPFFLFAYPLDRALDNRANLTRLENQLDELANRTGGRLIFRRQSEDYFSFVSRIWFRFRNQVRLSVTFPCFRPAPVTDHVAGLKVEGRDVERIAFRATSAPAPVPRITKITPSSLQREALRDERARVAIEGSGFCGEPNALKVLVEGRPVEVRSAASSRIEVLVDSSAEGGEVKVVNLFGRSNEERGKLLIEESDSGSEASSVLTVLVLALVLVAAAGVLVPALRSRRAKLSSKTVESPPVAIGKAVQPAAGPGVDELATLRNLPIARAWIRRTDGTRVQLREGVNLIGRDRTCTVKLDLPGVSREHARLELISTSGFVWLEDLGSTNGTEVERPAGAAKSRANQRMLLSDSDVVVIMGERMTLHFER